MSKPVRTRWRDRAGALVFTLLWLVPVSWTVAFGEPPAALPTVARDLCGVTCLFPTRPAEHVDQYVQLRREGSEGWEDLNESARFRLEPFGYRTRLDRYLTRWAWQRPVAQRELLRWLREADDAAGPPASRIVALRVGVRRVPLTRFGDPTDLPARGRFAKPPRREVAPQVSWGDAVWIRGRANGD